jgi:hypothetical protein
MKTIDIEGLDGMVCLQGVYVDAEVLDGYTSDLLSDVMAHAKEGSVLITIQAHKNSVAVCSLVGAVAMLICNNRPADDDMLAAAASEGIAVFRTPSNQFQTSALIAQHIHHCPAG